MPLVRPGLQFAAAPKAAPSADDALAAMAADAGAGAGGGGGLFD